MSVVGGVMRYGRTVAQLLVLMCGVGVAADTVLLAQAESPRAVVAEPRHDFGTVRQGERLVHTFEIRNDGSAPLTIARIELSVPGTKVRFAKIIAPSTSGQVTMEWDTSSVQGAFEAAALLVVNDPRRTRVPISLAAVVKAPIEYVPFPEVFFSAYRDETPERSVRIVNNEPRPLTINRAESASNHYDVRVVPERDGFVYDVRVKVRPGVPFGRYPGEPIYLHTDDPERPRLQIQANLLVKPDFYASPEDVTFATMRVEQLTGQTKSSAALKESVTLSNRQGPVEIARIESDIPALQITRSPAAGSSQRFRLDISLDPEKMTTGTLSGTIRIVTTDPAIAPLLIPVRGEVR